MKKTLSLIILLVVLLMLVSCGRDTYSKEEANSLEMKGLEMASEFLYENFTDYIVATCDPIEEFVAGGPHGLTSFVSCSAHHKTNTDEIMSFVINTETGDVYTDEQWQALECEVKDKLTEGWALTDAVIDSLELAPYTLPYEATSPDAWASSWSFNVIPYGIDAESFFQDSESRGALTIENCIILLADGTDPFEWYLANINGSPLEKVNIYRLIVRSGEEDYVTYNL